MKEFFEIKDFKSNKNINNVEVVLNDGETIKIINDNNLEVDTNIKYLPKSNINYRVHHSRNFSGSIYLKYGFDYSNIIYKHNNFFFYKTKCNLLESTCATELKQYYNLFIMDENFKLLYYTKYSIVGFENSSYFKSNYSLYNSNDDEYCDKYNDIDELLNYFINKKD